MDIQTITVPEFKTGNGSIDTTPAKAGPAYKAVKGVTIKADLANGDNIYVGWNDVVSSTNGFTLDAGEEVTIPVDSLDKVWVVGGDTGQGYSWLCI